MAVRVCVDLGMGVGIFVGVAVATGVLVGMVVDVATGGDIDRREYRQESSLTKAPLDATRVSVDDEVVRYGDHIEGLLEAWGARRWRSAISC